jgi:HAD superfamily hydrolase (TIGR01549 family)
MEFMQPQIEAIFIDLGNTMRILTKDEAYQESARIKIAQMVGSTQAPETLVRVIDEHYKAYRKWAFETWIEATEGELWTRWLLPDYPAEKIIPIASELTYHFRQSMGKRIVQPDAKMVVNELTKRGYLLGIISNVIGVHEIPDWLEADGLTHYFKSVVLSSVFGRRKPDPEIYWEAARRIGVPPEKCVYIGDNPNRDVVGTRNAGFGMVILLMNTADVEKEPLSGENQPDLIINQFKQLLDIFPSK